MKPSLTIDGFDEMDSRLIGLSVIADEDRLKAIGIDALQPVAEAARTLVRTRSGQLRDSITAGDRLGPAQAAASSPEPGTVEVYVGPGSLSQAITEEFGTAHEMPHPYLRPAWDGQSGEVMKRVAAALGSDLRQAAKG